MRILPVLALAAIQSACTIALPFQNRVSYEAVADAKAAKKDGPGLSLKWLPASFPERVDVQGASGFVGGASRTRIPTGPAISQRVTELLDASLGLKATGTPLTIEVVNAHSTFQYSAGMFNITPAIDRAGCTFEAKFTLGTKTWTSTFKAEKKDPKIGGTSQTGLLEQVWDDIAVQVYKDVLAHG